MSSTRSDFAPDFTFVATLANGDAMPGQWAYAPATSGLWLQYQNGYWLKVQLMQDGNRLRASYNDTKIGHCDLYLEKETENVPNATQEILADGRVRMAVDDIGEPGRFACQSRFLATGDGCFRESIAC